MIRNSALILLPLSFLLLISLAAPAGMAQRDISRDRYLPAAAIFGARTQPENDHRPILIPSRNDTIDALRIKAPSGLKPHFELLKND